MTSLNPLLRAYGRFDVAQGRFTLYSQLGVKNANINGYVKPMFSDLKVYDYQKDKNKGLIGQAKQMLVGTAAQIFKIARGSAGDRAGGRRTGRDYFQIEGQEVASYPERG